MYMKFATRPFEPTAKKNLRALRTDVVFDTCLWEEVRMVITIHQDIGRG